MMFDQIYSNLIAEANSIYTTFVFLEEDEYTYPLATGKDVQAYADDIDWKGKIIYMSPEKFLSLAAPLRDGFVNHDSLMKLRTRMKDQLPLDPLVLVVDMKTKEIIGHEGRHRAKVCIEVGVKEVPVLIATGSNYPRTPRWTPEQHKEVEDVVNFKQEGSR